MQSAESTDRPKQPKRSRKRTPGLPHSHELAWLIQQSPSALGETGTLAGTIAVLERGGADGYPSEVMPGGPTYQNGDAARASRLLKRWRKLESDHQAILLGHYSALPREPRVMAPGERGSRPIGQRLEVLVGDLAGVVCVVAVSDARAARRRRWGTMVKTRVALLEDARQAAQEAIPHMVADLRELRERITRALHGELPGARCWARLRAVEAATRQLLPDGAGEADAALRKALVSLAEAEHRAQESVMPEDWRELIRAVERSERKLLSRFCQRGREKLVAAHDAWGEAEEDVSHPPNADERESAVCQLAVPAGMPERRAQLAREDRGFRWANPRKAL